MVLRRAGFGVQGSHSFGRYSVVVKYLDTKSQNLLAEETVAIISGEKRTTKHKAIMSFNPPSQ